MTSVVKDGKRRLSALDKRRIETTSAGSICTCTRGCRHRRSAPSQALLSSAFSLLRASANLSRERRPLSAFASFFFAFCAPHTHAALRPESLLPMVTGAVVLIVGANLADEVLELSWGDGRHGGHEHEKEGLYSRLRGANAGMHSHLYHPISNHGVAPSDFRHTTRAGSGSWL